MLSMESSGAHHTSDTSPVDLKSINFESVHFVSESDITYESYPSQTKNSSKNAQNNKFKSVDEF